MKNKLILALFLILVFIAGCQSSQKNASFEKLCKEKTPDNWMDLKPMKDGKFVSDVSCWGCMSEDGMNHFCSIGEYKNYLKSH